MLITLGLIFQKWKTTPIDSRLHLPSANPFLPTDLSIKPSKEKVLHIALSMGGRRSGCNCLAYPFKICDDQIAHPYLLRTSTMSKLWYKPDSKFQTPKACIEIHFDTPESYGSPEAVVLSTLFLNLLLDYLNEHGKIDAHKLLPIQ